MVAVIYRVGVAVTKHKGMVIVPIKVVLSSVGVMFRLVIGPISMVFKASLRQRH